MPQTQKYMREIIISLVAIFSTVNLIIAQEQEASLGIRIGTSNGISCKAYLSPKNAGELILILRSGGFNVTGLYERQLAVKNSRTFFYFGAGAHVGYIYSILWENIDETKDPSIIGIDGVIGLEYLCAKIPLGLSLDWKPALNVIGNSAFRITEFAISLRYLF